MQVENVRVSLITAQLIDDYVAMLRKEYLASATCQPLNEPASVQLAGYADHVAVLRKEYLASVDAREKSLAKAVAETQAADGLQRAQDEPDKPLARNQSDCVAAWQTWVNESCLARNQGDCLAAWQKWVNEARFPDSPESLRNTARPVSEAQAIADRLRATADLLDVEFPSTDETEDALDEIDMIRGDVADLLRVRP